MEDDQQIPALSRYGDYPGWKQALARAAYIVGGWAALDRATGMKRNYFYRVMKEFTKPTLDIAVRVSTATAGQVRVSEIVPELAALVREEDRAARFRSRVA